MSKDKSKEDKAKDYNLNMLKKRLFREMSTYLGSINYQLFVDAGIEPFITGECAERMAKAAWKAFEEDVRKGKEIDSKR